jgi:predicted O-linked N-acetylglucosamine transferase (SPINDLY family)
MDDTAAAAKIAEDGIQILVDVNGYTREARTKLVAMRPAPIIVNWLGYPGTMASPYHHYIMADDVIIPKSHEIYYSEKVLRLPCYQPNNRKRIISPRHPTRAECHLPANGTVFCCFNGTHKITRATYMRWLEILRQVPESVLWLLSGAPGVESRLRKTAEENGIKGERIIFADKRANPDHLARYPLADLFLDCLPYGAHTTASDALWMGVPVLTLVGRSFAARVCASLVTSAGLPELCCGTPDLYIKQAVKLGSNRSALKNCKEKLAANRDHCTLFNTPGLVRAMEALYEQMLEDFRQEKLPKPDLTNLDRYFEIGIDRDHESLDFEDDNTYFFWWNNKLKEDNAASSLPNDARLFQGG